ncbi:hypothetical protein BV504_06275 [Halomonas sp. 'Soap Lake |nr:hypothetical protein B2G49_06275 [Halomonas sp. 'Soap Lake \
MPILDAKGKPEWVSNHGLLFERQPFQAPCLTELTLKAYLKGLLKLQAPLEELAKRNRQRYW